MFLVDFYDFTSDSRTLIDMCGIFAYLNYKVSKSRRFVLQALINGLKRLEYRGYDSAVNFKAFVLGSWAWCPYDCKGKGQYDDESYKYLYCKRIEER